MRTPVRYEIVVFFLHAQCVAILICPSVASCLIGLFLIDKDNAPAKSGMIHIVSQNELSFAPAHAQKFPQMLVNDVLEVDYSV